MEALLQFFDLKPLDVPMIGVGVVLFLAYLSLIRKTLFEPYLALFEARERATKGAVQDAGQLHAEAEQLLKKYEQQTGDVRVAAMQRKLEKLQAAKKEAGRVESEAAAAAQEILGRSRRENAERAAALRKELSSDIDALSEQAINRVNQMVM